MPWAPWLILAIMAATWITAFARRSPRLNWAVALMGLALASAEAAGLTR